MKRILVAALLWLASFPALAQQSSDGVGVNYTTSASGVLVALSQPGRIFSLVVTSGASAGYVMLFDATTEPSDGTVSPKYCWSLPATTTLAGPWPFPATFGSGLVIVFSTGANCFSKTKSSTAFIGAQAQ